jgi:hypothetical protein
LALHAGRTTAADALGFGVVDLQGEAEHQGRGHHYEVFHPLSPVWEN